MDAVARAEALAKVCARLRGVVGAQWLARGGAGRRQAVEPTPADPQVLADVEARLRLPALYVEYLRRHHCEAFRRDFVLRWRGVSLMLVGAEDLDEATASYANGEWPQAWVVIGYEYEGCYFIDVESGEVRYLDHGAGLRYDEAGSDLVEFLEQVLEASDVGEEPEAEAEASGPEALADASTAAPAASGGAASAGPARPRLELPAELWAVAIGLATAVVILVVVLLLDGLGLLD